MNRDIAIALEGIGKQYLIRHRVGHTAPSIYRTLREEITEWFSRSNRSKASTELFWAVKALSLEVQRGEILGLIGRNGAGKSTMLKILSRITEPTTGRFELRGRVASLLEVGTGFHPELTGRENVFLNGSILGMSRQETAARFDEIVGFAEVGNFIDTPVKRFSSGMYARLAFAIAAHLDTEILLVDEVLSVGDAEFRSRCLNRIGKVSQSGRTVIFVSHNLAAVENLCDRVAVMDRGKLSFIGKPAEALHIYADSISTSEDWDMVKSASRLGRGGVRFTGCQISEQESTAPAQLGSGLPFSLQLRFSIPGEVPSGLRFGLHIYTEQGIHLLTHNSTLTDRRFDNIVTQGTVVWDCEGLPLMSGDYRMEIFAKSNAGMEDQVENALTLHIEARDIFGTGRLPRRGTLLIHGDWRLQ